MKLLRLALVLVFPFALVAQTKEITNEEIWNFEFSSERLEEIHPLTTVSQYTVLEVDRRTRTSKVVSYDYATANVTEEIVNSATSALVPFFTSYSFSKDEKKLLLESETEPIYRRSKRAKYFVYDRTTNKTSLLFGSKIQEPKFSPDGSKVAFVFERNLYVKDLGANSIEQITSDGSEHIINGLSDWVYEEEFGFVRAFDWNADGSALAFMQFDETLVPTYSMDVIGDNLYPFPYTFKYPKAGETNSVVGLYLYSLADKNVTSILLGDEKPYYIPRIKFSPNKNKLMVQTINRHQNHLQLWSYDIQQRTAQVILEERENTYVDVHDNLKFLKDESFLWTSERDGYNHIYHYKADGTLKKQLTQGDWEVTRFFGVQEKTKEVYYASVEPGSTERAVYSVKLNGSRKRALSPENGTNGVAFSADYKYYIHTFEDSNTPTQYNLRSTETGKIIRPIEDNANLKNKLSNYSLSTKEFSTIEINGNELNMWMIKPKDFDPNKKYPLLMYQYSGPGSQKVANSWNDTNDFWHQSLVQKGYIVACVDGRGTGFKGTAFKKVTYKQLVHFETLDQIEVARKLGQKPFIDAERIGIWGWSYGGHMSTNCILKGNDVFSLAIAVAPVTSWRFYDTIYTERFMRTPQENPEGYDLNSPFNYPELLKGDYLLIHGSGDDNVHLQNTMRMAEALVQANKPFELMIYPDKNHGIYGGNTRLHLYNKMTNFILNKL
ncbi:MAG: S9 family peptidase [Flavobacteriales bacterium]|jgi:dipeptidyl-peptidase-4|tara:strand:+ start:1497 stop:3659 length:2163 start_codon:yes stop_codon:yes gene_type:complete